MSDYRKLKVWVKAHAMSLSVHRATARIRGSNYAALRNQMTRAAMSVPTNLVEGRDQKTEPGFARYVRISLSSASELEYHLLSARDMGAMAVSEYLALSTQVIEVRMMLHGLLRRLERSDAESS